MNTYKKTPTIAARRLRKTKNNIYFVNIYYLQRGYVLVEERSRSHVFETILTIRYGPKRFFNSIETYDLGYWTDAKPVRFIVIIYVYVTCNIRSVKRVAVCAQLLRAFDFGPLKYVSMKKHTK